MPVRKIPKNYRNVTGVNFSSKSKGSPEFESTLERDFITILDFDPLVKSFEVQPFKIEYKNLDDKTRTYTPDVLVHYYPSLSFPKPRTILYEVKYRKDLKKDWPILKRKFQAAVRFTRELGWIFTIITELEIRRPYLDNIKFLKRYRQGINDERLSIAIKIMEDLRETDPQTLVAAIASDFSNRAEVTYLVWQMIALGYLQTDLTKPLSMHTRIWLK